MKRKGERQRKGPKERKEREDLAADIDGEEAVLLHDHSAQVSLLSPTPLYTEVARAEEVIAYKYRRCFCLNPEA